jgi:hypothetical protein
MGKEEIKHNPCSDRIWLISKERDLSLDLGEVFAGTRIESVKEYRISDIAKYMINPNPVKVNKRLVGCELVHRRSGWQALKQRMGTLFSKKEKGISRRGTNREELLTTMVLPDVSEIATPELNAHINHVYDLLTPFDAVVQKLSNLPKDTVMDVNGICEDLEGNRSFMHIREPVENKIQFIINNLSKNISVLLEKAHLKRGLFEMRGYDFKAYNPDNQNRLVKFVKDGKPGLCTITRDNRPEYMTGDVELITYLQMFELALKGNPRLENLIHTYCQGAATPTKIFFNQEIKTEYSRANLPLVYRKMEAKGTIGPREKKLITRVLNRKQFGLSFNYISRNGEFKDRVITSVFVMQDVNALEPIKLLAPGLYSTLNSRAAISEAGTFYLIDSIRGVQDEPRV